MKALNEYILNAVIEMSEDKLIAVEFKYEGVLFKLFKTDLFYSDYAEMLLKQYETALNSDIAMGSIKFIHTSGVVMKEVK